MSLTTDDLKQIRGVIDESIDEAITRRVDPRFIELEAKIEHEVGTLAAATKVQFDQMDERFDHVEDRLGRIEEDLAVTKDLVKDHSFRIARLEHRLPSAG